MSHGSAMSFTWLMTGSCWTMSKKADSRSTSWRLRASVEARSKRNPSTCISVAHQRRLSITSCSVCGLRMLSVLPVPV